MQSAPPALQLGNVQADPQLFSKRYQMEGGDASVALLSTPRKDTDIERKERQRNLQFLINKMEQERSIVGSVPLVTMGRTMSQGALSDPAEEEGLRRTKSYEDFREIDEAWQPDPDELLHEKCITVPVSPKDLRKRKNPLNNSARLIELMDELKAECMFDNVYAEGVEGEDPDVAIRRLK